MVKKKKLKVVMFGLKSYSKIKIKNFQDFGSFSRLPIKEKI